MKKLVLVLALLAFASPAMAQVSVNGYYRSNGTYVQPYQRTAPDNNVYNNYSTRGNYNPHTGQAGTVNPSYSQPSQSFGSMYRPSSNQFVKDAYGGFGR